jgi:NAD(P)-dependent dehydrogenase (short-subunit alcohol dehydrogenase family)
MDTASAPLDGQAAIVTGGGAGIGRGIALGLARAGANVVIAEIDARRGEEAALSVREAGREALFVPTDVMNTDQVRAMVAAAADRFGRVDVLINNAGGVRARRFLEQSERSWRRHIDLNLVSMLASTHAAAPLMIRGGRGGVILNVASIEASRAAPMFSVYAACKAGMTSFTRSMAVELAEHGIRVNCIAPDHTRTPGILGQGSGAADDAKLRERSGEERDAFRRVIPLGREGVVEECANAAVFLCSPQSSYVTGVTLPVDGGTWAAGGWLRRKEGDGWILCDGIADWDAVPSGIGSNRSA